MPEQLISTTGRFYQTSTFGYQTVLVPTTNDSDDAYQELYDGNGSNSEHKLQDCLGLLVHLSVRKDM